MKIWKSLELSQPHLRCYQEIACSTSGQQVTRREI
jgi:hypothetical protein